MEMTCTKLSIILVCTDFYFAVKETDRFPSCIYDRGKYTFFLTLPKLPISIDRSLFYLKNRPVNSIYICYASLRIFVAMGIIPV